MTRSSRSFDREIWVGEGCEGKGKAKGKGKGELGPHADTLEVCEAGGVRESGELVLMRRVRSVLSMLIECVECVERVQRVERILLDDGKFEKKLLAVTLEIRCRN